jgi:RNA polymerase sigma factor (sigma-70 family)
MQGFEDVVIQQQRKVHSFAHYFLGSPEEAEDVTQEVFLKLWQNWASVDQERVRPWLLRVTRNACYDRLRRRRSTSRVIDGNADPEILETSPGTAPGPEADARHAAFRRDIEAELQNLGEPYRSILILREIQGLRYREISEILDLPLNTVRVYIHRGRRRLREQLAGRYDSVAIV